MNYKVQKVLKDNKKNIIIMLVLWVFLSIVLVAPIAYTIGISTSASGQFDLSIFITNIFSEIATFSAITRVFEYGEIYGKVLLYFSIMYLVFAFIGLYRSKPKHQYTDIEHGSSDWSEGGEQYSILSRNKGIILAQDNYLPVDKRGNVNVLVVGRFWIW